ncbi:hypothetical protein PTKIN_Ptkin07bG0274400 [Pterospermum kingtungense]
MDSKMVSAMLIFGSLTLIILFPSISCGTGTRNAVGGGQFSDSFHEVLDFGFSSSLHHEDQHIAWMSVSSFNMITGPKMELTFQDFYGTDLTSAALSAVWKRRICSFKYGQAIYEDVDFVTLKNSTSLDTRSRKQKPWSIFEREDESRSTTSSYPMRPAVFIMGDDENTFCEHYRRQRWWGLLCAAKAEFRIGVPVTSNNYKITLFSNDMNHTTHITRFSISVFEAAVRRLRYKLTYKLIPFYGSPDELVMEVSRKIFDVAIGEIVTTAAHYQLVEFSLPYLETGFTMVVKAETQELNKFWWFLSPFTTEMWVIIAAFNALIGAVIWIIESQEGDGPNFLESLFFLHRRPLQNNAARILKVLWVFVVLILTQVYTSMLTTMLTNPVQQKPSILDIDSVKWTNAAIGCDGQPRTMSYLVKVLGFKRRNIRIFASIDDYAAALSSDNIKAAFLSTPNAKVLLAKHCAGFTQIKPTYGYKLGGFGFVFPKGSPLASDISAAILEMEENGELQLMEDEMLSFSDCSSKVSDEDATIRAIEPSSFRGFFVLCGTCSAIALLFTSIKLLGRDWERRIQRMLMGREMWMLRTRMRRVLMGRQP